jgi:hypothetical protein
MKFDTDVHEKLPGYLNLYLGWTILKATLREILSRFLSVTR